MTLDEYVLLGLTSYGLPALGGAILLAALGVPLPASLLLLAAGAFVDQGSLSLGWVLGVATIGAVLGDLLGYGLGRWGGTRLIARLGGWAGGPDRLAQAERLTRRWGGWGVFLSRWLLTPLGPVLNLTSGLGRYPVLAFLCFDLAGEALWVTLYVTLGKLFSDQVQTISALLGNLTWALVGVAAIVVLLWLLFRYRRAPDPAPS